LQIALSQPFEELQFLNLDSCDGLDNTHYL